MQANTVGCLGEGKVKVYARLIVAIALCQMAGAVGSLFTAPAIPTWYAGLRKPDITPPNWVFAPVWTTLYILMGASLFLVWNAGLDKGPVRRSIILFGIQLLMNAIWSYLFFGLRSPLLGLVWIMALWVSIALTIASFSKVSKAAASLLIPYLIWVTFASYLNYRILILNP
ncbi:MAG: TspO/MBR family protein [Candidatus Bathyarchaeia archaeon]